MERQMELGGSVVLKVTPEVLIRQADTVLKDLAEIQKHMTTIEEKVEGTAHYWIGPAGQLHRHLYNEQKEEIMAIMQRLNEHPRHLKLIASEYTKVETQVAETANALTDHVII